MKFTKKQLENNDCTELKLKDVSKYKLKSFGVENQPLTSDETLYEISLVKASLNKQILTNLKEAAIDCSVHSKHSGKDKVECYSFGLVSPDKIAYTPKIKDDEEDEEYNKNKRKEIAQVGTIINEGNNITYAYNTRAIVSKTDPDIAIHILYDLEKYKKQEDEVVGEVHINNKLGTYKFIINQ